jgi:hypothetical protein
MIDPCSQLGYPIKNFLDIFIMNESLRLLQLLLSIIPRTEQYRVGDGGRLPLVITDGDSRPYRLIQFIHTDSFDRFFLEYYPEHNIGNDWWRPILDVHHSPVNHPKPYSYTVEGEELVTLLMALEDKSGLTLLV